MSKYVIENLLVNTLINPELTGSSLCFHSLSTCIKKKKITKDYLRRCSKGAVQWVKKNIKISGQFVISVNA